MPSKQQLDKEAWGWIEYTEPDKVTLEHVKCAYHLNLEPCKLGKCKRNCRGNPLCLNSIGERVWLRQIDERKWHDIGDPNNERRHPDSFVGLKNLGATCYVNTFLQLWFHNQQVRKAVYQWRSREQPPPDNPNDGEWTPSTICGHLQLIFALLQFSKQRYIDPSNFIKHLGLNTAQQQDAQEFSKLFLSLLEDTLMQSDNPNIKNVIEEQFSGEYSYVTRCSQCSSKSKTPSKFYELDLNIRGSKTLHDCLAEFLQEEKLEGDNKYMCSQCKSKQNAIRTILLEKLPPVLNLQLLRFVFDKQNGQKKKLNSYIQFPEVLDMTDYLKHSASPSDNSSSTISSCCSGGGTVSSSSCCNMMNAGPSSSSNYCCNKISSSCCNSNISSSSINRSCCGSSSSSSNISSNMMNTGGNCCSRSNMVMNTTSCCGNISNICSSSGNIGSSCRSNLISSSCRSSNICSSNISSSSCRGSSICSSSSNIGSSCSSSSSSSGNFGSTCSSSSGNICSSNINSNICSGSNISSSSNICSGGGNISSSSRCGGSRSVSPVLYDLSAVLIHRGVSAYSGHYIAHIKDRESQAWYKFNDEETERMQGRNLHLGNEEEVHMQQSSNAANKGKAPRLTKGYHSSRNAYMLVYTRRATREVKASTTMLTSSSSSTLTAGCSSSGGDYYNSSSSSGVGGGGSSSSEKVKEELLPQHVRSYIARDNQRFENWIQELLNMRDQSVEIGRERQEEIKYVYYSLVPDGNVLPTLEWLSLEWLSRWLTDPIKAPSINNHNFLCCHSRVNPNKVSKLKFVRSEGAAALFAKFAGGPRLLGEDSLCKVCVQKQCHVMRMKQKMETDMKYITTVMKFNHDTAECYWIGKSSFRRWRKLLAEKLEEAKKYNSDNNNDDDDDDDGATAAADNNNNNNDDDDDDDDSSKGGGDCPSDNSNKCSEETSFNNDLLCTPHRSLKPEVGCRRLVPPDVWKILRSYFPKCPQYQRDDAVCAKCVVASQMEQQTLDQQKEWAVQQKAALPDLYHQRNRPNVSNTKDCVYVVSVNFVDEWRRAVKDPIKYKPVTTVRNSALICVHGGMLYEANLSSAYIDVPCITYLWPEEWTFIEASCTVDIVITVHRHNTDTHTAFVCKPGVCQDCLLSRLQQEEQQRFEYSGAKIYVRKVLKDWQQLKSTMGYTSLCNTNTPANTTTATTTTTTTTTTHKMTSECMEDKNDLDFQIGGKRARTDDGTNTTTTTTICNSSSSSCNSTTTNITTTTTTTAAATAPNTTTTTLNITDTTTTTTTTNTTISSITAAACSENVRRSHRHRRMRGEKEVTVSSTDTLRNLKLQIMKLFSVPPFDQNLHFNGTCLLDETATLGQLRISPGCLILLKADEPSTDPSVVDDILTSSSYGEEGFKGTGLLSG
ncbi:hypothetical protein Ahia01_001089700 [Argonauta hians]